MHKQRLMAFGIVSTARRKKLKSIPMVSKLIISLKRLLFLKQSNIREYNIRLHLLGVGLSHIVVS